MTAAHPIARAWFAAAGQGRASTGAPNYDEFADDAEITGIIAANPASALAVEMPHLSPENLGRTLRDCLPDAAARLRGDQAAGRYHPATDAAALYRITAPDGAVGYGLWCMIDTAEISTRADEPGRVIRNEDVFAEKVRERVALAEAIGCLLSPVLLLQTKLGRQLHTAIGAAIEEAGPAAVTDRDATGRTHEVWPLAAGPTRDRLLNLAGDGELVVADGNHRSLAAQTARLERFLAVVTTPGSVTIQPYNRLVSELPLPLAQLADALAGTGATVTRHQGAAADLVIPERGTAVLYTRLGVWSVTLPPDPEADPVDNLDHALVERNLLGGALGLDPGDKRIAYVGGDYPAPWLRGEVEAGRAELAILIAPVTVDDFVSVNLARKKMPRKSTWFTPKARAGLVLADLRTPSA